MAKGDQVPMFEAVPDDDVRRSVLKYFRRWPQGGYQGPWAVLGKKLWWIASKGKAGLRYDPEDKVIAELRRLGFLFGLQLPTGRETVVATKPIRDLYEERR